MGNQTLHATLLQLISRDNFEEAILLLLKYEECEETIAISGRFRRLSRAQMQRTISHSDGEIEHNQIREYLLKFCSRLTNGTQIVEYSESTLYSQPGPSQAESSKKPETQDIELTINGDFDSYSDAQRLQLLEAIKNLLAIKGEVKLKAMARGSIRMTLELTPAQCERLYWAIQKGKLNEFNVSDSKILDTDQLPPAPDNPASLKNGKPPIKFLSASGWALSALMAVALVWQLNEKHAMQELLKELQTKTADMEARISECDTRMQAQAKMQQQIALLRDSNTYVITMTDIVNSGSKMHFTIWHNIQLNKTVLDLSNLPAPGQGRYFQVFAIVDGAPRSLGMINTGGTESWQELPFIQNADAFAISVEGNPSGNPLPTVVVALGAVGLRSK